MALLETGDPTAESPKSEDLAKFSKENTTFRFYFIIFRITIIIIDMKSYRNPDVPAASRAVNLVRGHHEVPGEGEGELIPSASVRNASLRRNWIREARANHLQARRRTMKFDEIPAEQFPVILEVSGGSNFVVLKERNENGECLVQFPDSRESIVDESRIAEVYDGTCVFLNPKNAGKRSRRGGGLRRWLASR